MTETNEFIDDHNPAERGVMSHEEIAELKAQGLSAEAIIQRQMARHENFDLKTDFSKEKWRKRKEKKCAVLHARQVSSADPLAGTCRRCTRSRPRRSIWSRTMACGPHNRSCIYEKTRYRRCWYWRTCGLGGGTSSWTIQAALLLRQRWSASGAKGGF